MKKPMTRQNFSKNLKAKPFRVRPVWPFLPPPSILLFSTDRWTVSNRKKKPNHKGSEVNLKTAIANLLDRIWVITNPLTGLCGKFRIHQPNIAIFNVVKKNMQVLYNHLPWLKFKYFSFSLLFIFMGRMRSESYTNEAHWVLSFW